MAEPDPTETTLILHRLGAERAVALGEEAELRRLGSIEQPLSSGLVDVIRAATVSLSAFHGLGSDLGGGLVRLTPEAQTLLAQHGPALNRAGDVLGVVRGSDGRFTGVVTFQEVGGTAAAVANLPALMAALAIQAQLASIERKLGEIQADVESIVRDGQVEVMAEARAALDILADVHSDVTGSGLLTDDDWARASEVELTVRRLHHQTTEQLRQLARALADPDVGIGRRVVRLAEASRNERVRFWFEAHVLAEIAMTRWEILRLERLARTDDPRLLTEVEQLDGALAERRLFTESFAAHLADYIANAGRVDTWLDRIRFIKRAHLERLILELEQVLAAYRQWQPEQSAEQLGTVDEPAGLTTGSSDRVEWQRLVSEVRSRAASPVRRIGDAAGSTWEAVSSRVRRYSETNDEE